MCGDRCGPVFFHTHTPPSPPAAGNQRHQRAEEHRAGPGTGVRRSSSGAGMGQPLFSFQDNSGGILCSPPRTATPCPCPGGSPSPEERSSETLRSKHRGIPAPDTQGGSWHAKELGAGTVPLPHIVPGWRVDVLRSRLRGGRTVLSPVTARCPAWPAGSAPQPASWRCRGSCPRAGKGCCADLQRGKKPEGG